MQPKPKHLGVEYAVQFKDSSIVEACSYRPSYPQETFQILASLISDEPRAVLDIGCGTGYVARELIEFVDRIDAVDFSENMIETAKHLPNGDHRGINWICSSVEEAPVAPPYALITAGDSLHWMDWDVVFPRFKSALAPNGYLTIVGQKHSPMPWQSDLFELIQRYSTNQDFAPYDLIEELTSRNLFQVHGEKATEPVPFQQSIDDYIESIHGRNGFSRDRMSRAEAQAFDGEAKKLITKHCSDGKARFQVSGRVIWGKPL